SRCLRPRTAPDAAPPSTPRTPRRNALARSPDTGAQAANSSTLPLQSSKPDASEIVQALQLGFEGRCPKTRQAVRPAAIDGIERFHESRLFEPGQCGIQGAR